MQEGPKHRAAAPNASSSRSVPTEAAGSGETVGQGSARGGDCDDVRTTSEPEQQISSTVWSPLSHRIQFPIALRVGGPVGGWVKGSSAWTKRALGLESVSCVNRLSSRQKMADA